MEYMRTPMFSPEELGFRFDHDEKETMLDRRGQLECHVDHCCGSERPPGLF